MTHTYQARTEYFSCGRPVDEA